MVRGFHLKIFSTRYPNVHTSIRSLAEVYQSGNLNVLRRERPLEESCGLPWTEDNAQDGVGSDPVPVAVLPYFFSLRYNVL